MQLYALHSGLAKIVYLKMVLFFLEHLLSDANRLLNGLTSDNYIFRKIVLFFLEHLLSGASR